MVDSYVYGNSTRQSPEAPVPVIKEYKIDFAPGGAGNVAMNLKSLGANVSCLGYIGKDAPGEELIKIFEQVNNIKINYVFTKRRQGDPGICFADNRLAKKLLKWSPRYSYKEMLKDAWNSSK